VGVLAGRWDFDRPSPVEIAVAESKSELLDLELLQRAFVEGNEAVGCKDTALVGTSRCYEEIKRPVSLAVAACVLNKTLVYDAATRRVLKMTSLVPQEEPLVDPLVHHHEG